MSKSVTKRANAVKARYGKTTKGTAKQVKPKAKVRPTGGKGRIGIKAKVRF